MAVLVEGGTLGDAVAASGLTAAACERAYLEASRRAAEGAALDVEAEATRRGRPVPAVSESDVRLDAWARAGEQRARPVDWRRVP